MRGPRQCDSGTQPIAEHSRMSGRMDRPLDRIQLCHAYGCRISGRWPVPVKHRLLCGGLPRDTVHRVQRGQRTLSLLHESVQFLDGHDRGPATIPKAAKGHPQSGQPQVPNKSLPSLYKEHVNVSSCPPSLLPSLSVSTFSLSPSLYAPVIFYFSALLPTFPLRSSCSFAPFSRAAV